MSPEVSFAKKNGNGNGISQDIIKPKPAGLPRPDSWGIRRDMPRPGKKEPRKKTIQAP